jgi:hypothetical protein
MRVGQQTALAMRWAESPASVSWPGSARPPTSSKVTSAKSWVTGPSPVMTLIKESCRTLKGPTR